MPTTLSQLDSPYTSQAITALASAKERQAYHSNRNAKARASLEAGDTVRFKMNNDSDWRKTEVSRVLPYFSYDVMTDDDATYRQTLKHVHFSTEPPITVIYDTANTSSLPGSSQR